MTLEEAIKLLKQYQGYEPISPDGETLKHAFDLTDETVDTLLTALHPVSREQVEKAWPGCPKCKYEDGREPMRIYYPDGWDNGIGFEYGNAIFCPECGRPLTDEAVQMVMERLEALYENT